MGLFKKKEEKKPEPMPETKTEGVKVESKQKEQPKEVTLLDVVASMTTIQYQAEVLARLISMDERLKKFEDESTKP